MDIHSIRFSYVLSVFFTFLLLVENVCDFSSAFLCVRIRTNQTVTYWTQVFRKKIFVKWYSSISKYRSYCLYTKFLKKIFIYIYDSLLSAYMDLPRNEDEKAHTFSRRCKIVKKWTKTDKKRILCKFSLTNKTCLGNASCSENTRANSAKNLC